jgi:hypothetical protein
MVRCHGEGFNWREADIDPMAVYASGGGKSMDGESLINFILILCLYNAMIYSYVIHITGIPCLMV